jgi:hypothetical protein
MAFVVVFLTVFLTVLLTVLLTSVATVARAQEPEEPRPTSIVVADLSLGVIGAGYCHVLVPEVALEVVAHYYQPWYHADSIFGLGGEVRAYLHPYRDAPDGFYVSPGVRVDWVHDERTAIVRDGIGTSIRVTAGAAFRLFDMMLIRLGAGGQVEIAELGDATASFVELRPAIDIQLGLAF